LDDIIQAASGIAGLFTRAGHAEPSFIPANLCDRMTGLAAAHAAIAALFMRFRTGQGQSVEVPMFETLTQMILGDHLNGEAYLPAIAEPGYSRLLNRFRRPFKTQDGYVALAPYTDKQFRAFYVAIGREADFDADERINTLEARARNYDVAYAQLGDILLHRSSQAWTTLCAAHEIPCQHVNSIEDLLADPHLNAVGFFQEVEHPTEGRVRQLRPAARWSTADTGMRHLPPRVGEHSDEVLREVGYSDEDIARLKACGATVQAVPAGDADELAAAQQ
jgi:crotonobetainyl-CoA:carnitine CoA-transferase CaiB-like acyl-CoA transferase